MRISTWLKYTGALALLALAFGCASTKQTDQLLTLAGFKPVIASTPKQQQQLEALPPGKVSQVQRKGKIYYVYPDVAHNQVYVGSPKQYRNYRQIRADYQLSSVSLAAPRVGEDTASGYDDWEGWEAVVWGD